jgi:4-amino-4-deoxy-L-arabinose transferase-like glycosyltransferase
MTSLSSFWPARKTAQTFDAAHLPSKTWTWLLLPLVLLICFPPLWIDLRRGSPTTMENIAIVSARETWERQHGGEAKAWLIPSINGEPFIVKPPMIVWIDLLAWWDLDPAASEVGNFIERARYVAISHGLVFLAGVFWLGLILDGRKLAVLATLIAGSNLFFVRQARTASYDIILAAWATLAIASALWVIRPNGSPPARAKQLLGWGVVAFAFAMASTTKGPAALVVPLPLIAAILMVPWRRWSNCIGLLASVGLGVIPIAVWHFYVWQHVPSAGSQLIIDYGEIFSDTRPIYRYLALSSLVLPWTLWLLYGLVLPFIGDLGRRRWPILISWCWFVVIFLFFSAFPYKADRYMLPLIPAVALLAAQAWLEWESVAQRRESPPGMQKLSLLHWVGITVVSVGFGPFLGLQSWLVAQRWLSRAVFVVPPWRVGAAICIFLLLLTYLGWHWHMIRQPLRAAIVTALWAILVCTLSHKASESLEIRPVQVHAERVVAHVARAPLRYLNHAPSDEFLLYLGRIVPAVEKGELLSYAASASRVYVIAVSEESSDALLSDTGFTVVFDFEDSRSLNRQRRLWEHADTGFQASHEREAARPSR